jgi:hypothetical protein
VFLRIKLSLKSEKRRNSQESLTNMTKRFTAIIIIANVIMGLLLYLSSQLVLSELNGATLSGFNISSIGITPTQVGPVIVPIEMVMPNFPFYIFLFFLIVNACFIIKLLISKETKQTLLKPTS